ncbi:MAG: hypothetical protein LW808_003675 [Verrucomicrobiota bacterium]|nr:MAG: hypothetical protein LW808_003675 [Verrucomicrobiota bacterium]
MKGPQYSAEVRAHKLAEILVAPPIFEEFQEKCSLVEVLSKSFAERVLWLETQSREQLEDLIGEYERYTALNVRKGPGKTIRK